MKILVLAGTIRCGHDGTVRQAASQQWVRIAGSPVLVAHDPQGRPIAGCPNIGLNIKPCTNTLAVHTGYSGFVSIGGHAVCLDSVTGYTDGTPPGAVKYTVRSAGQDFTEAPS
jgi:hypothetical protein